MTHAIMQTLPLLLVFLAGILLKRTRILSSDDGSSLLRVIFAAGLPALVFISVMSVKINASMLWYVLFAPLAAAIFLGTLFFFRRSALRSLDHRTFGALVAGSVIMNTGFLIPFVQSAYGLEGVARLIVIDTANGVVTFTLVYAVIAALGHEKPDPRLIAQKVLMSPPLWALAAAFLLRATGLPAPSVVTDTFVFVGRLVGPAILLALGLKFAPRLRFPGLLTLGLALRFGLGALVGLVFVKLSGLHHLDAVILMLAAMAPIGFNAITFSEMEHLDTEFAASLVSAGLIVGLIVTPVAIAVLPTLGL